MAIVAEASGLSSVCAIGRLLVPVNLRSDCQDWMRANGIRDTYVSTSRVADHRYQPIREEHMRVARLLAAAVALIGISSAPALAAGAGPESAHEPALQNSQVQARDVGVAAHATVHGCRYLEFCTYVYRNYTVMVDRVKSCTWHKSHGYFRSYVNNQSPGTRASLYSYDRHRLSFTKPAFAQNTTSLGWAYYLRPC